MKTSNDWKQNLDEIFRLHENRIERELLEMSRTIETHTAINDDDMNFMTTLFDYMQLRLIATCKKIEVNFLIRQAVPGLRSRRDDSSVGETIDMDGLKDDFPDQVLKIVEDTDRDGSDATAETTNSDSNDDDDCSGSNETLVGSYHSSSSISM